MIVDVVGLSGSRRCEGAISWAQVQLRNRSAGVWRWSGEELELLLAQAFSLAVQHPQLCEVEKILEHVVFPGAVALQFPQWLLILDHAEWCSDAFCLFLKIQRGLFNQTSRINLQGMCASPEEMPCVGLKQAERNNKGPEQDMNPPKRRPP